MHMMATFTAFLHIPHIITNDYESTAQIDLLNFVIYLIVKYLNTVAREQKFDVK